MNLKAAAALVSALLLAPGLVGCGNAVGEVERVGRVGVSVDDSGAPVVVVAPCREGTAKVRIDLTRSPDADPDAKNEEVGSWTAAQPSAERSELVVTDPGSGWSGDPVQPPAADTSWIVSAGYDSDKNQTMGQVVVSGSELAGLTPDQVLVSADGQKSTAEPRASFEGDCENN